MNVGRPAREQVALRWHKSSYSGPEGGNCLEVATVGDVFRVRDSKNGGGRLVFARIYWARFVGDLAAR